MTTPEQAKSENMEKMRAGIKGMENQIVGLKAQIAKKKAALDEMEKAECVQSKLDRVAKQIGIPLDKKRYTPADLVQIIEKCDLAYARLDPQRGLHLVRNNLAQIFPSR